LLVVAIHAALVLIAMRWVTRVHLRHEESLAFLVLPAPQQDRPLPAPPSLAPSTRPRMNARASPDTQLIRVPAPGVIANEPPAPIAPAPAPAPAPIDWNVEADLAIKQYAELVMAAPPRALDRHGAGADLNGGLGPDRERKSDFAWDHSHTHRIEGIEGGGILIHINDHCVLVVFPLPFVGCGIGKIPVRGDLFEHLHDAPALDASSKNTAP
jgi:hypothetical protein